MTVWPNNSLRTTAMQGMVNEQGNEMEGTMGIMDNIKDNMSDEMRARYEDLQKREENGDLDDEGRMELERIRSRMSGM